MKRLLCAAMVVAAGLALWQRRRAGRDDEELWTSATQAADLR